METINRAQKAEHLESRPPTDLYLSKVDTRVSLDNKFSFGTTELNDSNPYYDFRYWLQTTQQPRDMTLGQTLEAYEEAIKSEHERIEGVIDETQPVLLQRLELLADKNYLPKVLADRMTKYGASNYRVSVVDSFMLQKLHGPNSTKAPAYYLSDDDSIYLRPFGSKNRITHDYIHETVHALSGASTKKRKIDDPHRRTIFTSRQGLRTIVLDEYGYANEVLKHRALNEAVTEHIVNMVLYDRPDAISPEQRMGKDSGRYKVERQILQIIADRIGIDVVMGAYAEDYDPSQPRTTDNLRSFVRAMRQNFGPGFLRQLDKVDREQGVERALDFMRAADYLASKKVQSGKSLGRVAARKQKAA